jgi:uncharacterized Ntn-hydrolase superfamily protein
MKTKGPGLPYNTFTIVARCEATRALGICLASSPLTGASRCPYVRAGVGAVSTQAHTNPELGPAALDMLQAGRSPAQVIEALKADDRWIEYRQIGIVDAAGQAAVFTGSETAAWAGHETGPGFVAMGNKLVGQAVVEAIAGSFRSSAAEPLLEERLMAAIEAGRDAGGQEVGLLSGGLMVCGAEAHPRTDLRVEMANPVPDEGGDAVDDLRRVFDAFKPLIPYYQEWPGNPAMDNWRTWLDKKAE